VGSARAAKVEESRSEVMSYLTYWLNTTPQVPCQEFFNKGSRSLWNSFSRPGKERGQPLSQDGWPFSFVTVAECASILKESG
jgi:hypothetical protein